MTLHLIADAGGLQVREDSVADLVQIEREKKREEDRPGFKNMEQRCVWVRSVSSAQLWNAGRVFLYSVRLTERLRVGEEIEDVLYSYVRAEVARQEHDSRKARKSREEEEEEERKEKEMLEVRYRF